MFVVLIIRLLSWVNASSSRHNIICNNQSFDNECDDDVRSRLASAQLTVTDCLSMSANECNALCLASFVTKVGAVRDALDCGDELVQTLKSRTLEALCGGKLDVDVDPSMKIALRRLKQSRCKREQSPLMRTLLQRDDDSTQRDCGDHGRPSNGKCYCDQDGSGGGHYGNDCELAYDSSVDCDAGVVVHGECRCHRGHNGVRCERRCVTLSNLIACATLNGLLIDRDALGEMRGVEAHVRARVAPELRATLCREAVRRFLCHSDDAVDDDARGSSGGIDERTSVRVAYVILLHNTRHTWNETARADREPSNGLQLFRWLLDSIWHADDSFVVHVDERTHVAWYTDALAYVRAPRFASNVLVLERRSVVWASHDVVDVTLAALRALLANGRKWDLAINLSGSDVPLKASHELRRYLYARRGYNTVSSACCCRDDVFCVSCGRNMLTQSTLQWWSANFNQHM
jgi:hypothetical protein